MKKLFLIAFILVFIFWGCLNRDNNTWYKELIPPNMNLEDYIGKEVSVFLNALDKQYDVSIFLTHPPGYLIGALYFFERFFIEIYILPGNMQKDDPQPLSSRKKEDFLKEIISRIIIAPLPPQNEWRPELEIPMY